MTNIENIQETAISERELSQLTADMIDAHEESYPKMHDGAVGLGGALRGGFSRRRFIASASALMAGGALLATAGPAAASSVAHNARSGDAAKRGSSVPTDVLVAGLAASLENLAVATYSAGLAAAKAGKLGKVPPAIATFAVTARSQHADHAKAWNSAVHAAGYKAITAANPTVGKQIDAAFKNVHDVVGLAKLALSLEEAAAATYLEAIQALSSKEAINVAATIHPVEMQHAAILNFVLGNYPVPNTFAQLKAAVPVSDTKGLTFAKL